MRLVPSWCPDCRMYLGMLDADGEVPKTFLMPHVPGCKIGDREREALGAEGEPARSH